MSSFPALTEMVYDMLEDEAQEQFYINNAKKPAFLIVTGFWAKGKYDLIMNHVTRLGSFKRKKDAYEKLKQVLETAKISITLWKETRSGIREVFARKEVREVKGDTPT